MLQIAIVDSSHASRQTLLERVSSLLLQSNSQRECFPSPQVFAVSLEELHFQKAPELCLVGPELLAANVLELKKIRELLPASGLVCWANAEEDLLRCDQFARFGADDVIVGEVSAADFARRVILLWNRRRREARGKVVIVGAGKGGLGVTSVTAGLGEALLEAGAKVCLIDLDFDTQDLSRALRLKPSINENLSLLCEEQRPISAESVADCLLTAWEDESGLQCMPPPTATMYVEAQLSKTFSLIIDQLRISYDVILVDAAGVRHGLLRALFQAAHSYVHIINSDPASCYPSFARLRDAKAMLSKGARIVCLPNYVSPRRAGLRDPVPEEMGRDECVVLAPAVRFSYSVRAWPASGSSMYMCGTAVRRALRQTLGILEIFSPAEAHESFLMKAQSYLRSFSIKTIAGQPPKEISYLPYADSTASISDMEVREVPDVSPPALSHEQFVSKPILLSIEKGERHDREASPSTPPQWRRRVCLA